MIGVMTGVALTTPIVLDIARRLKADGRFVMRVEPNGWPSGQLQAVVDIGWAALQAGSILDRSVRLTTTQGVDGANTYTVTAEVVRR
jgi:hypothetical protein